MSTPSLRATDNGPWYRQPWPWLIMSGPFIVVVAGLFTAWLAVTTNDGLVTEDYYKKGMSINQTVAQSASAERLGLRADLSVSAERMTIMLSANDASFRPPPSIKVIVSHPTRAGLDQSRTMALIEGAYTASFQLPAAGHWVVLIGDEGQTWRLMGNVILPSSGKIEIGAGHDAARRNKE